MKKQNTPVDYIRIDKPNNLVSSQNFEKKRIAETGNQVFPEDKSIAESDNKPSQDDFYNKKIAERKDTILQYKHLESNNDCIYNSNRDIDTQALNLQVKLKNEKTSDKDLGDANVLSFLQKYVDSRHPRKKLDNGLYVPYSICSTHTGNIGCGESQSKSDLASLGLGMVIYFKVLKTFAILFLCLIVLNIPLYYIYYSNHKEFLVASYKDAFFKTTIGNIGSTLYNCDKIKVSDIYKSANYTFNLDCQTYNVTSVIDFGLSSNVAYTSTSFSSCQNYTNYLNITTDDNCSYADYLNNFTTSNCVGKTSCSFSADVTDIQTNCLSSTKNGYFFFSYSCSDSWVKMGNSKVDRTTMAWVIVVLDIASMFCLLIALITISIAQLRTQKFFKENLVEISDYTIHFTNLNLDNRIIYKELDDFIAHLTKIQKLENPDFKENDEFIYDINHPIFNDSKISMLNQRIAINSEIEEQEKHLMYNTEEKTLEKLVVLKEKEVELAHKIREIHYIHISKINDIYVTFTNQSYRNKMFRSFHKGMCTRCCIICCCKFHTIKQNYFRNRWVEIEEATDQPTNIRWQNITYSSFKRLLRKGLVLLIAIIILAISFGIIIGAKYAQESINNQFNTSIDCSFITYTDTSVLAEYSNSAISNGDKYLTYCYCINSLSTLGYKLTETAEISGVAVCKTWIGLYVKSLSLMVGTAILVPVVNVVLSSVLSILTDMERNKSVSTNITSNMLKSFFLQMINTAIIILLVNIYIAGIKDAIPTFPLFTGDFTDMDPGWYYQVGATFIFYMIINIFTPHTNALITWTITFCKRCFDSKFCNCGKSQTRKKTRKEYIDLYTGPEFNIGMRYSQILTTTFAILIYSSGLPILYVCCFFYFILTYWIDKWLMFRLYRNPPHIDLYASNIFTLIILFGVIVHFCFGIWIYGNSQILTDSSTSAISSISNWIKQYLSLNDNTFGAEILTRISYSYNVLILFILAITVIFFIMRIFYIDRLIYACFRCCDADMQKVKDVNIYDAIEIKGLYMNHQIRKAQYFVLTDAGRNFPYYKKQYFEKMLIQDRQHISRRLKELTTYNINPDDRDFDSNLARIIRTANTSEKPILHGEYSYNISYMPEYHVVAKHEYFDKYSNEEIDNISEEKLIIHD